MSIKIATSFDVGSNVPVDNRLVMNSTELKNVNDNVMPDSYLCVCPDLDGKIFIYNKSFELDPEFGRFRPFETSAETGELNVIDSISVNSINIIPDENKNVDITIPTKISELENDSKYQTESDVTTTLTDYATKAYVGEQIVNAEHLKREIVDILPSDEEASDKVIYMLKVESATGNDKYQEYMKIDGTVQMVGDTSVDLTDYAKTTDISTTLPANGGNANTVNNHTVKSDVPTDAVFTDTIYDDTEVKGSIEELSSKLGSTDISAIGNGTVTGAISAVNTNLGGLSTYSTEETKVGTWIDGKPIYRKVFKVLKSELDGNTNNTNIWYSPIFALSIDEIVNYDVLAFRNNGMVYKSVNYILNGSCGIAWTFSGFLAKENNSERRIGYFMGDALYNDLSHIYGILYYTKS